MEKLEMYVVEDVMIWLGAKRISDYTDVNGKGIIGDITNNVSVGYLFDSKLNKGYIMIKVNHSQPSFIETKEKEVINHLTALIYILKGGKLYA